MLNTQSKILNAQYSTLKTQYSKSNVQSLILNMFATDRLSHTSFEQLCHRLLVARRFRIAGLLSTFQTFT